MKLRSKMVRFVGGGSAGGGCAGGDEPSWQEFFTVPATNRGRRDGLVIPVTVDVFSGFMFGHVWHVRWRRHRVGEIPSHQLGLNSSQRQLNPQKFLKEKLFMPRLTRNTNVQCLNPTENVKVSL